MGWLYALSIRLQQQAGQTLAEYAIIITVIAVIVIITASLLGTNITGLFSKTSSHL